MSGDGGKPRILGIDLGTTNSCVAVYQDERPGILVNPQGQRTTPSVVNFADDGTVLVGAPAKRQAILNPKRTVTAVKRLIGRPFGSLEIKSAVELSPYEVVAAENGDAWVSVGGTAISPTEVSSHILELLHASAVAGLGHAAHQAVITVPAYFDESQRQATRDAATIAGLDVMRIVNEPTAAALAYGYGGSKDAKCLAVVDLGGGTYDVTIMMVEDGVFEVLATTGDMFLGGEDFDQAIARTMAEEIQQLHGVDPFTDAIATQRLLVEVEEAKRQLTSLNEAVIGLPSLIMGKDGPVNVQRKITTAEFESLTEHLVDRLAEPCLTALADANLDAIDIDDVLLVGGMTRCAAVRNRIGDLFNRRCSLRVNPDEAVALGAALESAILEGRLNQHVLIDVVPHTIGLRAKGNQMVPLIRRATTLPHRVSKVFSTTRDDQDHVDINVFQGDDPLATNNRHLSHLRLEDLPKGPKGSVQLAVTFSIDASGILSITARDRNSGKQASVAVVVAAGLPRDEVERLTEERRQRRARM